MYRVSSDRTLIGISFGGLFGAYDLLRTDRLFTRYLLVSPAFPWDHETVLRLESAYRTEHEELPVDLYVVVGGEDQSATLQSWQRWNAAIEQSAYHGLSYTTEELKGETHISVFPTALTHGLKALWGEGN